MTLEEAKVELEKFVKLKTTMRPAFVQPLLDAVEVVRCKDCIYCKRFNDVWYLPKKDELLCTRCVETYHTTENDYCSWGERREDADT